MFYITESELTEHFVFSCDSKSTETRCYIYPDYDLESTLYTRILIYISRTLE